MSQYLLSIYHDPGVHAAGTAYQSEEEMQAAFAKVGEFNERLMKDEQFVYACGLTPPESARRVNTDGSVLSGPASPGDRQLGGFWVIEVPDYETALAVAERGAAACGQQVEVRAMQ